MEQIFANIFSGVPLLLLKFFAIAFLLLHLAFSLILVRQTRLMNRVVEAKIAPSLLAISIIHLMASIFVLVWVILFL